MCIITDVSLVQNCSYFLIAEFNSRTQGILAQGHYTTLLTGHREISTRMIEVQYSPVQGQSCQV